MNIQRNQNQIVFNAKFINNKAFREVSKYAEETKQLQALDTALNNLLNTKTEDILLVHGINNGKVYSNFNIKHRAIQNLGAETPEKASFNAIIELGELGRKFSRLFGNNVKSNLSADKIIDRYAAKYNI